jgi:ArsR family transcriptional regulator, arsenate/arsenite/antimonite-responsive transcriptional repressor
MNSLVSRYMCEECADFFSAFSDKTRQEIVMIFTKQREFCVNDIASQFSLSRPTISHHLNLLKRAKILSSRKEGKEIYFSINKPYIVEILKSVLKDIDDCC